MKYSKIISIAIIIVTLLCVCSMSFADVTVDKYKPSKDPTMNSGGKLQSLSSRIIGTITTVGVIISVVGLIILGIKYMMGSVEEKANYRKTLIPMIVGFFFIIATGTIITLVFNLTKQVL